MIAVILDGAVINKGPWDYQRYEETVHGNPYTDSGDPPEYWDYQEYEVSRVGNPLPEGAVEGDFDICQTADGRYVLADNYELLRRAEYPSIRDQLDALFHAGVFPDEMAEKLRAVKEKHPKPAEPQ